MSTYLEKLSYAWSYPLETFTVDRTRGMGMVMSTIMFGGLEVADAVSTAIGENRPIDLAWQSVVFLGLIANAYNIIVRHTELPEQS